MLSNNLRDRVAFAIGEKIIQIVWEENGVLKALTNKGRILARSQVYEGSAFKGWSWEEIDLPNFNINN